ncbi:MAG: cytidylate kinase-like family protein [Chloroflexi bacterium]|nr:cytidylate kinase-like family protein [Chloroflexota bacterium]
MPVITITGLAGSGAPETGKEVARILGIDYVDRELLAEASQRIGAPLEALEKRDMKVVKARERVAKLLQTFLEKSAVTSSAGDPFMGPTGIEVLVSQTYAEAAETAHTKAEELDDARFLEVTMSIIKELARTGNVVIIGRGSQLILQHIPSVLHIFLVAPVENRIQLLMQRHNIDREKAHKLMIEIERDRRAYIRKFFHIDRDEPSLYHMTLNVEKMSFTMAAQIIAEGAKSLEKEKGSV